MPPRYLIKGLGRTGSHIIAEWLTVNQPLYRTHVTEFYSTSNSEWDPLYRSPGQMILHDHSTWLPPRAERSQWTLILSDRRNILDWACSQWISKTTKLYSHYSTWKPNSRYRVPEEFVAEFKDSVERWRENQRVWAELPWRQTLLIYREDLPSTVRPPRVDLLEPLRSVSNPLTWKNSEATPWQYDQIVENYQDLARQFGE